MIQFREKLRRRIRNGLLVLLYVCFVLAGASVVSGDEIVSQSRDPSNCGVAFDGVFQLRVLR